MEQTPRKPSKKRRSRFAPWLAAVCGVLLLAVILLVAVSLAPESKVIWLTPAGLNGARQPSSLSRFKSRMARLVWPLVGRYWHGNPSIRIDGYFLTLSPSAREQTGLGVPFATNADGVRIWILSAADFAAFHKRLDGLPGATFLSKPRVMTGNRIPAVMSMRGPTNNFTVDVTPSSVWGSINLTAGIIATEQSAPVPGKVPLMKTNLAAACRVQVPNAGGFVVSDGDPNDSSNSWWFIASPVQVDARGNPIKP